MAAAELGAVALERPMAISGADPVARARALIPLLEAAGPDIEQAKELVPEVVEALLGKGFLRLLLPASIGGGDISLPDFAEICEAIAIGDASTAWGVCQGNVSAMTAAAYLAP